MEKHIYKSILRILICIFALTILFSNISVRAEGLVSQDDKNIIQVTIEDIIFNRVPILDINFFSEIGRASCRERV